MKQKFILKSERICAFILALIFTFSLVPYSAFATGDIESGDETPEQTLPSTQDGTLQNPYIILTAEDFDKIRQYPDAYFIMQETINMLDVDFLPIEEDFTGVFNGNGYAIENLQITADDAALFLNIQNGGSVNNVLIRNADINGENTAAVIAVQNSGTISDVKIESASVSGEIAGSIAAKISGNAIIENSGTYADVSGEIAGGIVGEISGGELNNVFSGADVLAKPTDSKTVGTVFGITHDENFADNVLFLANSEQAANAGAYTDENDDIVTYTQEGLIFIVLGEDITLNVGESQTTPVLFSEIPSAGTVAFNTNKVSVLEVDSQSGDFTALEAGEANYNLKITLGDYKSTGGYTLPIAVTVADPTAPLNNDDGTGDDSEDDSSSQSGSGTGDDSEDDSSSQSGSGTGDDNEDDSNSQSGSGSDDDSDDNSNSQSGSGSDNDSEDNSNSQSGSGSDDDSEDDSNSQSGSGSDDDSEDDSNSQSGSGSDDDSDDDSNSQSGSGSDDDSEDDSTSQSGSGTGDDNEDDSEDDTPSVLEKGTWKHDGSVHSYMLADGTLAVGPHTIDDVKYIFDETGNVYRYSFVYDGAWYIADSTGALYAGGFLSFEDSTTYYDVEGAAKVGWITTADGTEYYQQPGENGRTNVLAKGVTQVDDTTFLFNSDGARQTGTGWVGGVYVQDGVVPTGKVELDGKTYIIGTNGLVMTGEFTFEGTNYYADENGVVFINAIRTMVQDGQTYLRYYDENGQIPTGWIDADDARYYQNEQLYLLTGRQTIENRIYFFGTNGELSEQDGWAGDYYVIDGQAVVGMQEIGENTYFFSEDGIVKKGAFTYESNNYYADETGALVKNSIVYTPESIGTYYGENGIAASEGFYEIEGETYYQKADFTLAKGKLVLDDVIYFFEADGKQITDTGWADNYYLQDGVALTGAYNIGDNFYIFAADGQVYKGTFQYEGNNYYADETGAVMKDYFYTNGTAITYYGEEGIAPTGWLDINSERYYQKDDFTLAVGVVQIEDIEYYFNSNGAIIKANWLGEKYIENGQIVTGAKTINGQKYIFSDLGIPFKHSFTYNNEKYYADGKGVLYTNSFITQNGNITYYDANGAAPLGFITLASGDTYYQSENYILLTGPHTIEGEIYFFGSDGILATEDGWAGDYYLLNGKAVIGMQTIDGKDYFFADTGLLVRGVFNYNEKEYRADENGVLYKLAIAYNEDGTGVYYSEDGTPANEGFISLGEERYYQTAQKILATGKYTIDGEIYFFSSNGALVADTGWADNYYLVEGKLVTGMFEIEGKTYIFNAEGELQKGEFTYENAFYTTDENGALYQNTIINLENSALRYLGENGIAPTGFVTFEGATYYQKADYTLATGVIEIEDETYYFDSNGKQQTGTGWVGEYYIINGTPATGLQTINGNKYVFSLEGKVQTGEFTHDGQTYVANSDGVLYLNTVHTRQDGTQIYLNEQGIAPLEWIQTSNATYYQTINSNVISLSTGFSIIDTYEYYFLSSGKLYKAPSAGYYLINNSPYYILTDGKIVRQPSINSIDTLHDANTKLYSVTVNFTLNSASSVHPNGSISFDNGVTWQTGNSITIDASKGATYPAGSIRVRDSHGLISYSTKTIYLAPVIEMPSTNANSGPGSYGVDVSRYQYAVDWNAVAASGIDFAIIRATSATNAGYYVDPYYEANVRGAKAAGLDVGVYIYSYASNEAEGKEEIDFFVNSQQTKALKADGIYFDYPVYVDYEDNLNLVGTTYDSRTNTVRYMMQLLEYYGYYPGFYTYHSYSAYFNVAQLVAEGYDFWYARYPMVPTPTINPSSSFGVEIGIWQYCSDGNTNPAKQPYVNGVYTSLDLNYAYVDLPSKVHAFYGISGQQTTPTAPSGTVTQNTLTVYDVNTGQTVTDTALNIVSKVVQAEVGGFNNTEVYKAQAVAAHSYILFASQNGGVANVALSTPSQAVINAASSVINQIVTYNGLVANTMWSAAASGVTYSSEAMWGTYFPYLVAGIQSPGDLNATTYLGYGTSYNGKNTTITTERAISNIEKILPGSTSGRTDYINWLTNPEYDEYGHLTYITVMGTRIKAGKFYDNFWGMYSPHCTMTYNNNGTWTFTTIGNGHGVGMSQWGAYDFALKGYTYSQILEHYYPGTSLLTF